MSVREAAERFRNNVHVTTEDFRITKDALRDYVTIKNAYLSEHQPDDGEDMDLLFMQSVGFTKDEEDMYWHYSISDCMEVCYDEEENKIVLECGYHYCDHITTRGQVRALLKLLEGK